MGRIVAFWNLGRIVAQPTLSSRERNDVKDVRTENTSNSEFKVNETIF